MSSFSSIAAPQGGLGFCNHFTLGQNLGMRCDNKQQQQCTWIKSLKGQSPSVETEKKGFDRGEG